MATIQKKSFWQQYGGLILILGGIAIGALIGAFAPSVGTCSPLWFLWCLCPSPPQWAAWPT